MKKRGERILGPYEQDNGWRVIEVFANGKRTNSMHETERAALRYIEILRADLERTDQTTETALDEYKRFLVDKGNKAETNAVIVWAVETFFPEPIHLKTLTPDRCAEIYEDLRTRPSQTGRPLANDTHRSALARTKSFLAWCTSKGWLRENPLSNVRGIGKLRPRGKSLGKSGNELRIKEARAWYVTAVSLAQKGDQGAIAALVALLLGMRANEIVSRKVQDLDDDSEAGDTLWIPCSKTAAGRRTLEVPEVLRPLLVACCEGKEPERYIFECVRPHEVGLGKPHWNKWIIRHVHRICDLAKVPRVTAHAMRGLLATITAERGLAGHLIAATLGHESSAITEHAYMAPGAKTTGVNRRGLLVLNGGVQASAKAAK